ncbi:cation-translocating P-type ATPase [Candidatus Gracilibacteria bacterium]|nr:cation-translocating P-type ATPase [Candidatus Gracilibacteria bacterium]
MIFHTLESDELQKQFATSPEGLRTAQAQEKLKQIGPNSLPQAKRRSLWMMIFEQVKSTLIIVLIVAAVLAAVLEKSYIDAGIILGIVIINTLIGVLQEYKTERTLEHLRNLLTPQARVMRDGKMQVISATDVVPGDILLIDEGEKIVADARVIVSGGLRVNQAILTGESVAQEKNTHTIPEATPLSDRTNMIYQGTSVAAGSGQAVVVATGSHTELGHISGMVGQIRDEVNPFSQKLEDFSRKIAIIITILCLFIVGVLLFEGGAFSHSFLVAVSLAVSAIPEGLPAVVALGLAFATKRLVKRNVLVRRLPASETLGRVTVICTDKTGTLTQSEMKVVDIYCDGTLNPTHTNELLFHTAILCNKAGYGRDATGVQKIFGDPTEIGLLESAEKHGFVKEELEKKYPTVFEFPFDSDRKRMSILRNTEGAIFSYVKGAPERILELITHETRGRETVELTPERIQELKQILQSLAGEGKRVLAMAYKKLSQKDAYTIEESESDLTFIGFMAMMDPPRVEVADAIKTCQEAGIRVIMITGDSELTAGAVAGMIGLGKNTLDATTLSTLSDEELGEKLKTIDVFSRIAPQDKLRIVRILKTQGHIIAMTGDGVNDALALKQADIGIAMGIRGTDVARDASDMVLLDDNFASIVSAVEEGRRIYDNTKKFIKYLLACNFYEVLLLAVCVIVFRDPLIVPFMAIQILWINLVTDSFPALALSTQETESDVMKRKPVDESLLAGIQGFIIWAGIIGMAVVGTIFFVFQGVNLVLAQTLAVTSSVVYQMLRSLSCGRLKPFDMRVNGWLMIAIEVSLVVHFGLLASPYAEAFGFVSLWEFKPEYFVWIFGLPIIGYILGEFSKYKKIG